MNTPVDLTTFEGWMHKLMERFDQNEQLLASLAGKEIKEVYFLDGVRLLDNQDVCQMLHASKRSVQRYRSSGTLKYHMLRGKIYYKETDVQEFIKTHFADFEQKKRPKKKKP